MFLKGWCTKSRKLSFKNLFFTSRGTNPFRKPPYFLFNGQKLIISQAKASKHERWPWGTQLFLGGCVPRGFPNVWSRKRIFLEKLSGFGNENFANLRLESWIFGQRQGWKCKIFLKIENGGAHERHIDGKLVD